MGKLNEVIGKRHVNADHIGRSLTLIPRGYNLLRVPNITGRQGGDHRLA